VIDRTKAKKYGGLGKKGPDPGILSSGPSGTGGGTSRPPDAVKGGSRTGKKEKKMVGSGTQLVGGTLKLEGRK